MKLLVVSDTHIGDPASGKPSYGEVNPEPDTAGELPDEALDAARDADGIIHAGDFTGEAALELFRGFGFPLYAVTGNMDSPKIARALEDTLAFELGRVRIGFAHWWGPPRGTENRIRELFPTAADIIIFGHSHKPLLMEDSGLLPLNPGSTARVPARGQRSYGWLFVDGGRARGELLYF